MLTQPKKKSGKPEPAPTSETAAFKKVAFGFSPDEVNVYISSLKKKNLELQASYERLAENASPEALEKLETLERRAREAEDRFFKEKELTTVLGSECAGLKDEVDRLKQQVSELSAALQMKEREQVAVEEPEIIAEEPQIIAEEPQVEQPVVEAELDYAIELGYPTVEEEVSVDLGYPTVEEEVVEEAIEEPIEEHDFTLDPDFAAFQFDEPAQEQVEETAEDGYDPEFVPEPIPGIEFVVEPEPEPVAEIEPEPEPEPEPEIVEELIAEPEPELLAEPEVVEELVAELEPMAEFEIEPIEEASLPVFEFIPETVAPPEPEPTEIIPEEFMQMIADAEDDEEDDDSYSYRVGGVKFDPTVEPIVEHVTVQDEEPIEPITQPGRVAMQLAEDFSELVVDVGLGINTEPESERGAELEPETEPVSKWDINQIGMGVELEPLEAEKPIMTPTLSEDAPAARASRIDFMSAPSKKTAKKSEQKTAKNTDDIELMPRVYDHENEKGDDLVAKNPLFKEKGEDLSEELYKAGLEDILSFSEPEAFEEPDEILMPDFSDFAAFTIEEDEEEDMTTSNF